MMLVLLARPLAADKHTAKKPLNLCRTESDHEN